MKEIVDKLFRMQDKDYAEFQSSLMPSVEKESVIGVRVPLLRAYAKELEKSNIVTEFLKELPHKYYEENNLHGYIIGRIKDYDECLRLIKEFLPYINNWATCDTILPKVFAKNKDKLIFEILQWVKSDNTYTLRFAVDMLMTHYLDENFKTDYNDIVVEIKSEEYYVNMMRAWYFATALAKQYDCTIGYFEKITLDKWTHNKAIQKAVESYRVSDEQKNYLKTLKIK